MHTNNIIKLLQSKPHNSHFLKRYISYLKICKAVNDLTNPTDIEEHHILPKADDLFPEYTDFDYAHKWNKIYLTPKQHVWAHIILWKMYGNSSSQCVAIHYMLNVQNSFTTSKSRREFPLALYIRYAVAAKVAYKEYRLGKAVYKDKEGNVFLLPTDDPRVLSGELVGNMTGHKMTNESKEKFRRAKDPYRTTQVYKFDGERKSKSILVSDLQKYIDNGWAEEKPEEYIFDAKENQRTKSSEALTGTTTFYYPSGTYYGRIPHDSPIIKELGLVHIRSDKQSKQASEQAKMNASRSDVQAKKSASVSKLKWCYDPETKINTRLETVPPGWILGKFGDSPIGGSSTWNDGVTNYRIKAGSPIPEGLVKGMAPRRKS